MFEKIIGNEKTKKLFEKSIKLETLSHSYIFLGEEGIGKKLFAKEIAKALLCLEENKYCNNCKSCIEFDTNNNPDYYIIEPDGNNIKIEQIREIQKKVLEKPIISKRKVYIINDSDKMTKEAQNCLLKTLEEPPKYVTIILIGSNESAFLSTIKSRCTIINFEKISIEEIQKYMKENYDFEFQNQNILKATEGSISKAIEIYEKKEKYEEIYELMINIKNIDIIETLKKAKIIYESKEDINKILDYINIIMLEQAKTDYRYTNCIQIVENTKKRLKSNTNYDMSIDNMILHIKEEIN